MISHLHEEFDPCVRQLIEHIARSDILCVVIVVIHHVAEMDHSPDVQFVSSIDQSPDRCVHDVSAVLHGVLGIRDQNDIVVVLISQLIALNRYTYRRYCSGSFTSHWLSSRHPEEILTSCRLP